jgi:hypothetical protein
VVILLAVAQVLLDRQIMVLLVELVDWVEGEQDTVQVLLTVVVVLLLVILNLIQELFLAGPE